MQFTCDIVTDLDVDGDGKLDSPEFVSSVLKEPIMLQCFLQTLPVTPPSCYDLAQKLIDMGTNDLSYESLKSQFLPRLRAIGEKVDVTALLSLMGNFCGCYEPEKPLLESFFQKLDPEAGVLTPNAIYCGIMRPLCETDRQKASLVYQVMNVDGDSHVTREEINDYLKEHQHGLGKRATHILSVFESLDHDGSGSVAIDEAKLSVQADSDIADFFDMLLQLTI
jgi:Ca2+-binding EF-hand superfamily protein